MATKGSAPTTHISPRNLYRQRWNIDVGGTAEFIRDKTGATFRSELLAVLARFNGGMVYEVRGRKYVLTEIVFGEHPFLFNFNLEPTAAVDFLSPHFVGIPDEITRNMRAACEGVVRGLKLPEDLHNVEVDLTPHMGHAVQLPKGWTLAKAIMKVPFGGVACDCDVNGPCGYCCDTCDCNSCYNCC